MQVCYPLKNLSTLLKKYISSVKTTLKVFCSFLCLIQMLKTMYLNQNQKKDMRVGPLFQVWEATTCMFVTVYPLLRFSFNVIIITQRNKAKKNYLGISDCLPGSYIACIFDDGGFIRDMIEGSSKSGLSSKIYGKISEQFQQATKRWYLLFYC